METVSSLPTSGTWRVVIRLTSRPGRSGVLLSRLAPLLPPPGPGSKDPLWVFVRPDPDHKDAIDLVGFYPECPITSTLDDVLAMLAERAGGDLATPPVVVVAPAEAEHTLRRSGRASG